MRDEASFQIVHEQTYDYALSNELTISVEQADEALGAIMYALNRNPSGFPVVFSRDIRVAKLAARPIDGLPQLRVFFRLVEDRSRVDLLYVDQG